MKIALILMHTFTYAYFHTRQSGKGAVILLWDREFVKEVSPIMYFLL